MRRTHRITLAIAALAMTVAGCGTASPGSSPGGGPGSPGSSSGSDAGTTTGSGSTTSPPSTPRSYAEQLLAALNLPADAAPTSHAPTKALESLPQRPSLVKPPTVVERFWTVDTSAAATMTWLQRHATDTSLRFDGSGGEPSRTAAQFLALRPASLPEGIGFARVYVAVAPLEAGRAAIGAYALTLMRPERPPAEDVPLAVTSVMIGWSLAPGGTPVRKVVTGVAARKLARDFNALQVSTSGIVHCPMLIPNNDVVLRFAADGHIWAATVPVCPGITVKRDGRSLPMLALSRAFLADLKHYVGSFPPSTGGGGAIPLVKPPVRH